MLFIKNIYYLNNKKKIFNIRYLSLFHNHNRINKDNLDLSNSVRVRFAPSPTGFLHLGGLRTALFNYLFAKANNGKFILRIEDTDKSRQVSGSVNALHDILHWCQIYEDEGPIKSKESINKLKNDYQYMGPYIQSERIPIYNKYAEDLIAKGKAYRCFCTSDELYEMKEKQKKLKQPIVYNKKCLYLSKEEIHLKLAQNQKNQKNENRNYTIRLKIEPGKTVVKDLIRGYISFCHSTIDDQVLIKSDGYPTYHLASVVDDFLMRISHVIRGEEWLSSTPKHILLYNALNIKPPKFAHLPLLLNPDRSKLSKRQGDVAVEDFKKKGFLSDGLINFVALLGWSPENGSTEEILSMEKLIQQFSLESINKGGSIVDLKRLNWINSRHIRLLFTKKEKKTLLHMIIPILQNYLDINKDIVSTSLVQTFDDDYILRAVDLMKERVHVLDDFGPLCYYFFTEPNFDSEIAKNLKKKYWKEEILVPLLSFITELENLAEDDFNSIEIMSILKQSSKKYKVSFKNLLMAVRYSVTGMEVGAAITDTIELLGKKKSINRIRSRFNIF